MEAVYTAASEGQAITSHLSDLSPSATRYRSVITRGEVHIYIHAILSGDKQDYLFSLATVLNKNTIL